MVKWGNAQIFLNNILILHYHKRCHFNFFNARLPDWPTLMLPSLCYILYKKNQLFYETTLILPYYYGPKWLTLCKMFLQNNQNKSNPNIIFGYIKQYFRVYCIENPVIIFSLILEVLLKLENKASLFEWKLINYDLTISTELTKKYVLILGHDIKNRINLMFL